MSTRLVPAVIRLGLLSLSLNTAAWPKPAVAEPPRALDERLRIELFCEHPRIVTPTGIATLGDDVLVVESHTHFRPENYEGPQADRILRLRDQDRDGRADEVQVFFEGTTSTMNLAVHEGRVYVATRNELFTLDVGADGRGENRRRLVFLETAGNYPHNGLSGFAFGVAGELDFGLGENLGADYVLIGADGTRLTGGGEGGGVYRCDLEGGRLRRLATGFWNPFHVACDPFGRLFAVDNDPDWRPPCRLVQVIDGGDYGYRFRNGRRGLHPFTAWFGELPGTLGVVAGTGEAPSGMLAYDSDLLPEDYRGDLLVTSWGYHAIERYRLTPRGATVVSVAETIIKGGEDFRPVGIALASDGSLFVSDWVSRSYNLHGQGRVWRVSRADGAAARRDASQPASQLSSGHGPARLEAARRLLRDEPELLRAAATGDPAPWVRAAAVDQLGAAGQLGWQQVEDERDPRVRALAARWLGANWPAPLAAEPPEVRLELLLRADVTDARHFEALLAACDGDDPFLASAARSTLLRAPERAREAAETLVRSGAAARRVEGALLLRMLDDEPARRHLPRLLEDGAPDVRRVAVQWVAESRLTEHEPRLRGALRDGRAGQGLLSAYLAALSQLRGVPAAQFEQSMEQEVAALLDEPALSDAALLLVLRTLPADHGALTWERLEDCLGAAHSVDVRREALRSLGGVVDAARQQRLAEIARDAAWPAELRAEALSSLAPQHEPSRDALLTVAVGPGDAELRRIALQTLDGALLTEEQRRALAAAPGLAGDESQLVARTLDPKWRAPARPEHRELEAWTRFAQEGDAVAGRRVFLGRTAQCARCHRLAGRGGEIGPDLTTAHRLPPLRLLESVVQPSREVAPQFVGWSIRGEDGRVFEGLFLTERGEDELYASSDGQIVSIQHDQIADRRPLANSIMPEGLVDRLTDRELADLLAYLGRP